MCQGAVFEQKAGDEAEDGANGKLQAGDVEGIAFSGGVADDGDLTSEN